jgi:hypothetical protein
LTPDRRAGSLKTVSGGEEMLDARAVVPDDVVCRDFEDETLVLKLGTGTYHGINPTGARTLELLRETGGDVRLTIERLARECDVAPGDVQGELLRFVAEMADRGLVELGHA